MSKPNVAKKFMKVMEAAVGESSLNEDDLSTIKRELTQAINDIGNKFSRYVQEYSDEIYKASTGRELIDVATRFKTLIADPFKGESSINPLIGKIKDI